MAMADLCFPICVLEKTVRVDEEMLLTKVDCDGIITEIVLGQSHYQSEYMVKKPRYWFCCTKVKKRS